MRNSYTYILAHVKFHKHDMIYKQPFHNHKMDSSAIGQ